jgi:hypothetical protein
MKVKVNRQLNAGAYHVNFEVADFTVEELKKMGSFGVPQIQLQWINPGIGRTSSAVPLNRISQQYDAVFNTEIDAKKYEEGVLNQIRGAMQRLRESQDKFSSSEEVAL